MRKILDGILHGGGFVMVVAVAFAIAWAPARLLSAGGGDILTVDPSERTNLFVRAGKDGSVKFAVSDAGKITVGATESYVNLVIQNDEVAAEADNKVDITADALTVEGIRLENVNVSANIESSGAGGLDTGSELADRWYYVWVTTNNNGTSVNGILTLAPLTPNPPTPPVLPSGFTKGRRVGAVRNNSSGNFLRFVQVGSKVMYNNGLGPPTRYLNPGTATTWETVSLATSVPPTSICGTINLVGTITHNTIGAYFDLQIRRTGSATSDGYFFLIFRTTTTNETSLSSFTEALLDTSQQLDYKWSSAPSTLRSAVIDVIGYYDRM